MTAQIIGRTRSHAYRRCERFFQERGIPYQTRDPVAKPLSPKELETIARAVGGFTTLIDESSKRYETRGLAYMEFDAREELVEDPMLLVAPIVRTDLGAAIDPPSDELERLTRSDTR
jgi:arsenate reductase-like glutaredoxin family protein